MNDHGPSSGHQPPPPACTQPAGSAAGATQAAGSSSPSGDHATTGLPIASLAQPRNAAAQPVGGSAPVGGQTTAARKDAVEQGALGFAITAACTVRIPEADAEARFNELKTQLPSRVARRMSRLGLMLSHLIGQSSICEDTVVIYASAFGEVRMLESYLASFPHASPLGFQSSIHPAGVEQALIFRQQPVREFFPVTASENLPLALLRTAAQCHAATRILLLGGEECGTWLRNHGLATSENFAFALLLEAQQHPAPLGWLRSGDGQPASATPAQNNGHSDDRAPSAPGDACDAASFSQTLLGLTTAIEARRGIDFAHPDQGHWSILWRHAD